MAALTAFGADVSGKYTGTVEFQNPNGESRKGEAYLDLKQEGDKLSGVAGPNESETYPIVNGKVEGDTLTFEVNTNNRQMKMVLKHDNGKLKGEATAEHEGTKMKALLELSRK